MTERKLRVSNRPKIRRRSIRGKLATSKGVIQISYTRPSFLEGIARSLDIGGTMGAKVEVVYEQDDTVKAGMEQDAEEIKEIWAEAGQYLYDAMGGFEESERGNSELTKSGK